MIRHSEAMENKNTQLVGCSHFKPKEPPTNEEYIHSIKGEQLAEFLVEHAEELTAPDGDYHKHVERFVVWWLQKEHEE